MDALPLLPVAAAEFERRLALVTPYDWTRPTPCEDWTVRELVEHVLGTTVRYRLMLEQVPAEELQRARETSFWSGDPLGSFRTTGAALEAAFAEPGALDRVVPQRVGPIPGRDLLALRLLECGLHAWDLARGIGADDRLGDDVLAGLDGALQLLQRPGVAAFYGNPLPVPAGASLQDSVLLRSGRTP